MKNDERKLAKCFDTPGRCRKFTELVYSGTHSNPRQVSQEMFKEKGSFSPPSPEYNVYFGDIHGHSQFSDGVPTIDEYYTRMRDVAKLDFAALSDHDHGGVGKEPLWNGKWDIIRKKAVEYNEPGKFTTILAYERDSYPWYNNLVIYYNNYDGELLRGKQDGELTREELREYLSRDDLILVPHDTQILSSGADFNAMELEDMTSLIQVYSRGKHLERYDPQFLIDSDCEGGHWQDALKRGAKMGCIAATDAHDGNGGLILEKYEYPKKYPAITGVWAKDNTLPSIFEALKARRCYGFMGGRITLDFRINGHYMGEEIFALDERGIYYNIKADGEIDTVTLVKNCRDYMIFKGKSEQFIFDYRKENKTDYYYIRVKLTDGRLAWSSPIWVD